MNPFSKADDALILAHSVEFAARMLGWTTEEVTRRKRHLQGLPDDSSVLRRIVIRGHAWLYDLQGRMRANLALI